MANDLVNTYALVMSFVIFMAIMAAALLLNRRLYRRTVADRQVNPVATQRELVTLRCGVCGYSSTREFVLGDYVGRVVDDKCPRDGSRLVVYSIFVERSG
jgi:hypothetical protein